MTLPPVLARIVVGHDAVMFDKPDNNNRTHKWKVFVRSPDGFPAFTDRSFIKKVTFQLHETFENPKRSVRSPPFEVEDTAYGCFSLPIKIHFKNVEQCFSIVYDITLPIQKVPAHIQYDHFIEISKPPSKDFINLVLKYGGKIKNCAPERVMPSATNKKVNESSDKHVKSAIPHVENQPTHSDHKNGAEKHKKHKKREKEHKNEKDHKKSKIKNESDASADNMSTYPASSKTENISDVPPAKHPKLTISNKPRELLPNSTEKTKVPTAEAISDVLEQVKEFANLPAAISPIGKLKVIKEEVSPSRNNQAGIVKDDAYWENFNKIRSLLSRPVKRSQYSLDFLHTLNSVNDEFISNYERPIPSIDFDSEFINIGFKAKDNSKLFGSVANSSEPQMLRLIQQKSSLSNNDLFD